MEQTKLIHTYTGPKYDRFWRIAFRIILLAGTLVGAALAAAPLYFYMKYQAAWLLVLFIFIPFGLWMIQKTLRHMKKLQWRHNHLSSYTLFEEHIEAAEWVETYSKSPIERVIPLSAVSSVIASSYVIRQTLSQSGFGGTITETGPILYILYENNGRQEVLNIPFQNHGDTGMNIWLSHFKKQQIPLRYTARQLYQIGTQHFNDEQRLEYFKSTSELREFPFTGNWLSDEPQAWANWKEQDAKRLTAEEAHSPELKKARQKHTFRTWIPTIWLVSMVMLLAAFALTKIGHLLPLPAGSPLPGLLIFTAGGFLFFFCLRNYLRWYYMLTFSLIVLILGASLGIMSYSLPGTEAELAFGISLASFFYPALVWIPYFSVKWKKNKKAGNLTAA